MRTIHKFPIAGGQIDLTLAHNAKPLAMQMQGQKMCLWVETDPEERQTFWQFVIVGTGHPVPEGHTYVATAQDGPFVWHLYY